MPKLKHKSGLKIIAWPVLRISLYCAEDPPFLGVLMTREIIVYLGE
jgi:hypothetical protein